MSKPDVGDVLVFRGPVREGEGNHPSFCLIRALRGMRLEGDPEYVSGQERADALAAFRDGRNTAGLVFYDGRTGHYHLTTQEEFDRPTRRLTSEQVNWRHYPSPAEGTFVVSYWLRGWTTLSGNQSFETPEEVTEYVQANNHLWHNYQVNVITHDEGRGVLAMKELE